MAVEELQGKYELMFILNPNMTQDETDKELESIKKFLEKNGKIFDDDIWGLRDLETRIKTNDKGYYVIYYLDFNPESITELNEYFTLNQNVLRHLLLTIPKGYEVKGYLNVVSRYEDQNLSEAKERGFLDTKQRHPSPSFRMTR